MIGGSWPEHGFDGLDPAFQPGVFPGVEMSGDLGQEGSVLGAFFGEIIFLFGDQQGCVRKVFFRDQGFKMVLLITTVRLKSE